MESKLSIFRKKAVGSPRDIRGQKPGFSHKMYFQPQGGRRMRWLGLLRQPSFLKNHFEIKLNAIKLTKVPGEPGKRVTQINGLGWARHLLKIMEVSDAGAGWGGPSFLALNHACIQMTWGVFTKAQCRAHALVEKLALQVCTE